MDCQENIILLTDSYKTTHHKMYPPNTTRLVCYFESRGGLFDETVFFGLQYIVKKYLCRSVTTEMIDEAEAIFEQHFGSPDIFNRSGWEHIVNEHGGKLPIKIRSVAEGSLVPVKNVLFTVESTDAAVPWVATYVETLLVQTWYPMTVCTNSFMQKRRILEGLRRTGSDSAEATIRTRLHDFGFRGSTSWESAGIGGMAHLVNFEGSDTLAALGVIRKFYNGSEPMPLKSIPAAEHSVMTCWGPTREMPAVEHLLEAFPNVMVSIVADSYDVHQFVEDLDVNLLQSRKNGCPVVVRPDSGDPEKIVLEILNALHEKLGAQVTQNTKGFKVLPDYVRVLQGDGVTLKTIENILNRLEKESWSAENLSFGSGGGLLQKLDRDTQKCAYKCSLAVIDGEKVDVFKSPVTDPGKESKKGHLTLVKRDGEFVTVRIEQMQPGDEDVFETIYENGQLLREYTFEDVRQLAETFL